MAKVVNELNLNTRYYGYNVPIGNPDASFLGNLFNLKMVEYYDDAPFKMELSVDSVYPENMRPSSLYIKFNNIDNKSFEIKNARLTEKITTLRNMNINMTKSFRLKLHLLN